MGGVCVPGKMQQHVLCLYCQRNAVNVSNSAPIRKGIEHGDNRFKMLAHCTVGNGLD